MRLINFWKTNEQSDRDPKNVLGTFIATKHRTDKLPQLTDVEKVKFDQDVDLDHLYYSSKIEGTNLTKDEMKRAITG